MNIGNFEFNCSKMGTGEVKYLSCKNMIKICRFKEPVFKTDNGGSYWVAEDKPLKSLLEAIKSRGISW